MNASDIIKALRCHVGYGGGCDECPAKHLKTDDPLPCKFSCEEALMLFAAAALEEGLKNERH